MALKHPRDLAAWAQWQNKLSPLRRLRSLLAVSEDPAPFVLTYRGTLPQVLVALESTTPSAVAANVSPLAALGQVGIAVLSPEPIEHLLTDGEWATVEIPCAAVQLPEALSGLKVILASGHFLPVGARAFEWAEYLGIRLTVLQHGLMTPFAPPLPLNAHLLAFSAEDADFWRSQRTDITVGVVGSQLLWNASQNPAPAVLDDERPLFLGQLHGAELSRRALVRTTMDFCSRTGATYRPHPAEVDKLSQLQHLYWQRRGIDIATDQQSFTSLARPVAAIFSTGVLEAAARGLPSWVTYSGDPPPWLSEFWHRYQLKRWGEEATPPPPTVSIEPSLAVANFVASEMGM